MSIDDQWNWYYISKRISMKDVINNPNERWDREGLSFNKNICMKVIETILPNATSLYNWDVISTYIGMEDVIRYPNERWNKKYLSCNENISMNIVRTYLPNAIDEWDWKNITLYSRIIVIRRVSDNIDSSYVKNTCRRRLSKSKHISMYWIRFKDRVGLEECRWDYDISIICTH